MSKYIDADALIENLISIFSDSKENVQIESGSYWEHNAVLEAINNAPTADVIEKDELENAYAHGHTDVESEYREIIAKMRKNVPAEWVIDEADSGDGTYEPYIEFHCSECGWDWGFESGQASWVYGELIPWNFCPNCGADMRGEGETRKVQDNTEGKE